MSILINLKCLDQCLAKVSVQKVLALINVIALVFAIRRQLRRLT